MEVEQSSFWACKRFVRIVVLCCAADLQAQAAVQARLMQERNPHAHTRIVFMTDMCDTSEDVGGPAALLAFSRTLAAEHLYCSYVGVGVDFDEATCRLITQVPCCNYFCIADKADFVERIVADLNSAFVPITDELTIVVRTFYHSVAVKVPCLLFRGFLF